ncbi:DUF4105 domain-containing protein [Oscillatoria amoena NRMC-F 0135]|nr:DUF4105 domain-containing protein [Oscillatoria amoena NRMC-F 0135]
MAWQAFVFIFRQSFKMKVVVSLAALLLLRFGAHAQIALSDEAEVSVITCGPGQTELYSAFGHSALRVIDPVNGFDLAFNYGVFDFNQPNFYINFARGHNYYKLAVQDYQRFEYVYKYYNRYVHEQVLNLTAWQKQRLFDYLQWNARPENQSYLYDYFYDNCATKLPQILTKVFGDSVRFNDSHITTRYSFRELTDLYLMWQPWGDLGIDICLGLPMDKKATPYQYMFLPDYVEAGFDNATLNGLPLVKQKNLVYESQPEELRNGLFQPLYVFTLFAIVVIILSWYDMKRKKLSNRLDVFLFGAVGAIGLLLFLLWTATDHRAATNNLNILWALPTHLVVAFALLKPRKWLKPYFFTVVFINVALVITWAWLPQKLHYALIPVVVALLARAFVRIRISPTS